MKAAMEACVNHSSLSKVSEDFKSVKRIVEDSKRHGWNTSLPEGYHLIQDVETKFGTSYSVAVRFLKAARVAQAGMVSKERDVAINAFHSLSKDIDPHTSTAGCFPIIQAILDAFKCAYDPTILLQGAAIPTIAMVLANYQYCLAELTRLENGDYVYRENGIRARRSSYTIALCGVLRSILEKV